jgi:hypothetical protein
MRSKLEPIGPDRRAEWSALGQSRPTGRSRTIRACLLRPESGQSADIWAGLLSATAGLMHRRKNSRYRYSITSSAGVSTSGGITKPNDLAVFKLMSISTLVACTCFGQSS